MNNFYVYLYLDITKPGQFIYDDLILEYEPFYIGKGNGNRLNRHKCQCFNKNDKKGYRRIFYQKLRKLINNNTLPIIIKFKENLNEFDAFSLEKHLIQKIGRRISKEGPLCNNSIGGEGAMGAIFPKYKISVFNNEGIRISIESSVKICSEKYKLPKIFIYKQITGIRALSKNGVRFRKFIDIENRIEKESDIKTGIKGSYKVHGGKSKEIYQYDLEDNLLNSFINTSVASEKLGILRTAINNNLLGKSKTCKKYKFKYKEI